MREVGVLEAKTQLSALLSEVEKTGETDRHHTPRPPSRADRKGADEGERSESVRRSPLAQDG